MTPGHRWFSFKRAESHLSAGPSNWAFGTEIGSRSSQGLSAGERVVSRGAYLVRLAALSTQIPAHGHVH